MLGNVLFVGGQRKQKGHHPSSGHMPFGAAGSEETVPREAWWWKREISYAAAAWRSCGHPNLHGSRFRFLRFLGSRDDASPRRLLLLLMWRGCI